MSGVGQSVKCPTLDCSTGHNLRVLRLSPTLGSTLGVDLLKILSRPLPLPDPTTLSLSKKKKKSL